MTTGLADNILELIGGLIVIGAIYGEEIITFVRRISRAVRGESDEET